MLDTNTSSCIAGPFRVRRIVTQVRTLVQHGDNLTSRIVSLPPFRISLSHHRLSVGSRIVGLATFRCAVVRALVHGGNGIIDGSSLVLRLCPSTRLQRDRAVSMLVKHLHGGVRTRCPRRIVAAIHNRNCLFRLH